MVTEQRHSAPLLITSGEPAGIGPDLCILLAAEGKLENTVVLGCPRLFATRAAMLKQNISTAIWPQRGDLTLLPIATASDVIPGTPDPANAPYVLSQLAEAADRVVQGDFAAVVTAPVHKAVINDAGIPFSGHTEFFQARAGVNKVVMMLACHGLRVALVTTHLPLRDVADAITTEVLTRTITITEQSLRQDFAIAAPKLAACGLNPHAGEDGHLGDEEKRLIIPALDSLRRQGINIDGPFPADTLLIPSHSAPYDTIIAMYHDQGLPVLKARGFGQAVNITLGLPYIRTSVDHGTALSLAGTGRVDCSSLCVAMQTARTMAENRQKT